MVINNSKKSKLSLILVAILFLFCAILFAGCGASGAWIYIMEISNSNYQIDRIIYTTSDKISDYTQNASEILLENIEPFYSRYKDKKDDDSDLLAVRKKNQGVKVYKKANNKYDIIVIPHVNNDWEDTNPDLTSMAWGQEIMMNMQRAHLGFAAYDGDILLYVNNSHIFSGAFYGYLIDGEVDTSEDSDGVYVPYDNSYFIMSGKWIDGKLSKYGLNDLSPLKFNELVVDGFDFLNMQRHYSEQDISSYGLTKDMEDFSYMFSDLPCKKITLKNPVGLTSNVKNISHMFENCTNLLEIDFGNFFDNIRPTNISSMFSNCPKLKDINLTMIDTSRCTNMANLFGASSSSKTKTRDDYLFYAINYEVLPAVAPEYTLAEGYPFDLDTIKYLIQTEMNSTFEETLRNFIRNGYLDCPMTYEEYCQAAFSMSMSDALSALNASPSSFGIEEKGNGEDYTMDEAMQIIYTQVKNSEGITLVTDDGLEYYYKYETEPTSYSSREEYLYYTANSVLIPEYYPAYQYRVPYSIEELIVAFGEGSSMEQMLVQMVIEGTLNCPVTYAEFISAQYNLTLEQAVTAVNADPSSFGLSAKGDGTDYTLDDLEKVAYDMAGAEGITLVTDEGLEYYYDYYTMPTKFKNRDEHLYYLINSVLIPENAPNYMYRYPYTVNEAVAMFGNMFDIENPTKEKIIVSLVLGEFINVPLTYDDLFEYQTGYKLNDETISAINANPSEFDLEEKQDGTDYTKEDIIQYIDSNMGAQLVQQYGITLLTTESLERYYKNSTFASGLGSHGTLTLGGDDSLFIINSGTDVTNLFGGNFSTIILPNQISESVATELPSYYRTSGQIIVNNVTSGLQSQTIYLTQISYDNTDDSDAGVAINITVILIALLITISIFVVAMSKKERHIQKRK